jgi:hypothetical protein
LSYLAKFLGETIMLHEFLAANRGELIKRCRSKVSKRDSPPVTSEELEYGVPLFLEQLIEALRLDLANSAPGPGVVVSGPWRKSPAAVEGSRTAALHGEELLAKGYLVDQVVHDYGDLCQAITELASETNAPVTVEEFHTLNRLLDNAIADAVSSYGSHRDESMHPEGDQDLHERMDILGEQQRELVETALRALAALKTGKIGLMGSTGSLLEDSLVQLRDLIDKALPDPRLATGMTASLKP